ncbi:MAG: flagella basal body P-ring formation protein FlgA [Fimbriiglobus sp.]|jgi:flagella basal body P-ring formation protein FlgA|nr:flagella basal body P-ring formation protein FlgA [Fimbriiglobus sp.]
MSAVRVLLLVLVLTLPAIAADPVSISLLPKPVGTDAVITIGQAARLSGGSAAAREKMAQLDLIDRTDIEAISRKLVRYRLKLAGFADADFTFGDAAVPNGALLSPEAVEEAARQELIRRLGVAPGEAYVDVVKPIVVKLPVAHASDVVELTAVPVGGAVKLGRTQMDVTIKVNGERKLTLPVFLNATAAGVVPVKAEKPADDIVVKARQRVTITVKSGGAIVTGAGMATEAGKLGQRIRVENLDSKKVISATVTGPEAVEIDLGEGK